MKKIRRTIDTLIHDITALPRECIMLLALFAAINAILTTRLMAMEDRHQEDTAQRQAAEQARDSALQELRVISLAVVQEKQERAAQAAAYAAVGAWEYIGECTITAYCPCAECCGRWSDGLTSTGLPAEPGIVAVDPQVIPLGSTVIIDGQRYLAADTGVTGNHVDICVTDHAAAETFGVQAAEVWVVRNG